MLLHYGHTIQQKCKGLKTKEKIQFSQNVHLVTLKTVHQFTCTKQKVPGNSKGHRSLQTHGCLKKKHSCHPSGAQNFEVGPRFLQNLWPIGNNDRP